MNSKRFHSSDEDDHPYDKHDKSMNKDNIDSDDEFKMNEFTKWKTQQEMNKLNRDKKKSKKKKEMAKAVLYVGICYQKTNQKCYFI